MVAEFVTLIVAFLSAAGELRHARGTDRYRVLVFGPGGRPSLLARLAPFLRVASLSAVCWGLITLLLLPLEGNKGPQLKTEDRQRFVMMLDVSPSMKLRDAGPKKNERRNERVRTLCESLFQRVPLSQLRVSIIAVYNGAKPVFIDSKDGAVVMNVLNDLPMHYAFPSGSTKLFDGLAEVAKIAQPWPPRSTSLLILTDGDTIPSTNMPKLPDSINSIVVVGVGDPFIGTFIDGRQSKQDQSTLEELAIRLKGTYHNGNEKQIPSDLVSMLAPPGSEDWLKKLTLREYALFSTVAGSLVFSLLPVFLHFQGTSWKPGTKTNDSSSMPRASSSRTYGELESVGKGA